MLLESINKATQQARSTKIFNELLTENSSVSGANEFLFFVKPEIFLDQPELKTRQIMEMIFDKMEAFGLQIKNARVLSAGYLEKHGIIAQHYGVINQIASDAKNKVSAGGKQKFEALFGESFDSANVMGGLEILKHYPGLNAEALDYVWQNVKFEKLAGGTYALKMKLDGTPVYLVNGFHARQLEHFTKPGRCIVVFTVTGDIDWTDARGAFIGATCPADAKDGSIRKTLLDNTTVFGLTAVTPSWNGVHLSAGPIEGLIELIRYQSNFEKGQKLGPADFAFGQLLIESFGVEKTDWILTNPNVDHNGESISVFDLTEEKNATEALELLKTVVSG